MDMTIDQQVALDEALVPHKCRLMIGKRVFRLRSDITSKESTLQVVYDVLRLTPFYKAESARDVYSKRRIIAVIELLIVEWHDYKHLNWITVRKDDDKLYKFKEGDFRRLRIQDIEDMLLLLVQGKLTNLTVEERFAFNVSLRIKPDTYRTDLKRKEAYTAYSNPRGFIYQNKYKQSRLTRIDELHKFSDDTLNDVRTDLDDRLKGIRMKNFAAYKEYCAIASGAAPLKTKASVRKTHSSFDTTMPPLTATGTRLSTSAKGKQPAKSSKAKGLSVLSEVALTEAEHMKLATKRSPQQTHISQASGSGVDEETGIIPGVLDVPSYESDKEISWKSSDEDDDDVDDQSDADDDEQVDKDEQDDDDQDLDNDNDEFIHPKLSTHDEEAKDEESFDPIVQTPSQVENFNDESNDDEGMNVGGYEGLDVEDDDEELYRDVNINLEGIDSLFESTYWVDVLVTTIVVLLLVTAPTLPPPSIPIISQVQQAPDPSPAIAPSTSLYIDHQMNEVIKVALQFQSDRIQDEAQAENEDFLNKLVENIQKIIKEKVKVQVSKILPKIEKTVNEQLEAEVLTRASNSSKTSYAVVADLSKLEVKKILIEKMENNKSIHRSDEHRNLYKALVDAYKCDKIILDTYGDMVTFKRCHDDEDKDEEPSDGSDRGLREDEHVKSQSQPVLQRKRHLRPLTSLLKGATDDQPVAEASQHPEWFQKQPKPLTPDHAWNKTLPATHGSIQPWISDLAKQANSRTLFNELMDTPMDFLAFLMNRLKVDTLTLELIAGRRVIPSDHFINNDLEYLCGGASSRKYTTSVTKTKTTDYGHIKWIKDLVPHTMWSQAPVSYDKYALSEISHWGCKRQQFYGSTAKKESALDVYSKRRIITKGDLKRLLIQDIEDMFLLLRVEDLQLGVKSYQNKLNLTNPGTYRSDLKHKEAYTTYSNPRGFIYQNKDKQNRLKRIDELHKFSDGTLNDVRTALDDHLKGIRIKYLPQTIWRRSDKERAAAMLQTIDKQLKTRRIMRSLEKFVGGRLYDEDFRMLQRTI
nr:hypothetical protein [Tanacetum cinerariifolium]